MSDHTTAEGSSVIHPHHYAGTCGLECIDAIRNALTPEEFRGYCKGAALKYLWRERKKGGDQDLAKAKAYLAFARNEDAS